MRTVIIDDERLARAELRVFLSNHPNVGICGEAANVSQALTLLEREKPDLAFLDSEMPGKNVFHPLAALPPPHPQIILSPRSTNSRSALLR